MAQNIEVAWEWPELRAMFERFGSFSRYLHFDKRGTGCSDRRSHVAGIDERVDDVRAVMDHADIPKAHFFVQSDGGPMAMLFAATYPQRVESLVLSGTGACLAPPWPEEERILRRDRVVAEWGTPDSRIVDVFAPSLAANQEFRTWHQRYERHAASTDSLRELLDLSAEMDVSDILPTISVPTLVLHRTGDQIVPVALGRELAAKIPGARLVELEGVDHFAYVGEVEPWITELERFVTGMVQPRSQPPRRGATTRIMTLGRFGVERGDEEVPISEWGSRRARQLCKRLVAARGRPLTREELIDMLWPGESDMTRLGARLSVQLSSVKRVLGGGVVADRQTVRLDTGEVATDLEEFYAAKDDDAIVAAYGGEFLPEDRYEDWTNAGRAEARTRFVTAARRVADRERSHGNHLQAAATRRLLLAADGYDEAAHHALVEELAAAGEANEARRAHAAWAAAMAEIDVEVAPFEQVARS
jgi:pimeloyl-ACP methyl ester carboxylesterase/DNA-binding SARP family transcriptional activator